MLRRSLRNLTQRRCLAVVVLVLAGCASEPDPSYTEFVVAVGEETFSVRTSSPEVARLARESLAGRRALFPAGPLRRGDGGFNWPWSWHHDPDAVALVEVAIEVCDARPSYVEQHLEQFLAVGYCPWGGRVIAIRP